MTGVVRDSLVVARYQLARALRTRSALLLVALFGLVSTGSAYGFTRVLLVLENQVARVLRVPQTETPGALMDAMKTDADFLDMLRAIVGSDELVLQWALDLPILTVTHFWTGLGTLPFIAAAAGAEAVSNDIQDRSIRFELVRAGRLEIVAGRFLGLSLLLAVAVFAATAGVWAVAMLCMINNPPLDQITTLVSMSPRLWVWCLPFCGLGVAASQLTDNVNLARLLALAAVAVTWISFGVIEGDLLKGWMQAAAESAEVILPQYWIGDLWGPGWGWLTPAGVFVALAWCAWSLGTPVMSRRNL
ncbi:ABC transporter permease subunit [Myxococcota bacterium]|nr:ABC transporter permease subunit [Myxococcota bacterium]